MFTVKPMPASLSPETTDLLLGVDPVKIGHFKTDRIMDCGMQALFPRRHAVGTAVTVHTPGADGTIIPLVMGMVRRGDFLVIDRGGDMKHAAWGAGLAYAALLIGVAGIAIDGLVCDISALRDHGVPTWHRGTSALTTQRLGQAGSINVPVTCGGITVNPGDAIAADENGLVVMAPEEVADLAAKAAAAKAAEPRTRRRLEAGEKLSDIRGTLDFIRSRGFAVDMP